MQVRGLRRLAIQRLHRRLRVHADDQTRVIGQEAHRFIAIQYLHIQQVRRNALVRMVTTSSAWVCGGMLRVISGS